MSNELILQTLIGAAEMLKQSPKTPAVLRKEVMSPGGTTEAGIEQLISHNFQEAMMQCIEQATIRSKYLGDTIDEKSRVNVRKVHLFLKRKRFFMIKMDKQIM